MSHQGTRLLVDILRRLRIVFSLLGVCASMAFGQLNTARPTIDSIASHARGIVGVAAIDLGSGDTLTLHGQAHFPMQSVFKFPLALAVLDHVDKGKLALNQKVRIAATDLRPNTWSPMRQNYPNGTAILTVDSVLNYVLGVSDNNGCDILFRLLGGTRAVNRYVHRLGVKDISIVATEHEMHQGWDVQYRNWSSPVAMAALLKLLFSGGVLSQASRDHLWELMAASSTGSGRIKGLLPAGTVVPHKSGSSGTNENGLAAATNDIGIIVLPDGRCVALVVFVSDSDAPDQERDGLIASIARAVWDGYAVH
jgi:beta-lactamase class A